MIAHAITTFALVGTLIPFPFGYSEHCTMSNDALRLAVRNVEYKLNSTGQPDDRLRRIADDAAASKCDEDARNRSTAYGDLVARVDDALNPGDYFLAYPGHAQSTDTVPADAVQALIHSPLQDYRLLHENREHFGGRALFSFRTWHSHALNEARHGRLELALVYNAFADHYLEDLFAPGHVFTPRDGLNDVLSGGIHNAYNRRGLTFYPRNIGDQLSQLMDASRTYGNPRVASLIDTVCGSMSANDCADSLGKGVDFFGDYQLSRSPAQRLVATLIIARSVEDIIESWLQPSGEVDSFALSTWCGYERVGDASPITWASPFISIPFGAYRREQGRGLPDSQKWPELRAMWTSLTRTGGLANVSVERLFAAYPNAWVDSARVGRPSLKQQDRTTHIGIDVQFPTTGPVIPNSLIGPFIRSTRAWNAVNGKVSGLLGGRAGYDRASKAKYVGEAHAGLGFELGFGILDFELRPVVSYSNKEHFALRMFTGLGVAFPNTGKSQPKIHQPVPLTDASSLTCASPLEIVR